jgi:radical SAM superfamily enzyme YgiQ (UPF0313 family)
MKLEKNKILLIEPPFNRLFKETYSLNRFPLSLGYLSGAIKKETDWDILVYNADFSPVSEAPKVSYQAGVGFYNYLAYLKDYSKPLWQEIKSQILKYGPQVVGLSSKSQNFASACIVAKLAKEVDEKIIVVLGGPHSSAVGKDVFQCQDIDVCVRGEGERTIVEFLKALEAKKEWSGVKGVAYRENGKIFENPSREYIENLDSLCVPCDIARDVLIDFDLYPITAFKYIFATRGCPYNCFFCGSRKIWSQKVRFRSAEHVMGEIKNLYERGLKSVHFDDDTFGINKEYTTKMCEAFIKYCPGMKWSCELHVKLVNEETIALMKKAGCFQIQLGIESGNNEILKAMRKNITVDEALRACRIIKKFGIELHTFFMIGFPQETEATLRDTIDVMDRIKSDLVIYSIFNPYPGTEAFAFCQANGLIDDKYDVSFHNHQSPMSHFCLNIKPERFRALASQLEKKLDKKNQNRKIKRLFSLNTLWRVQELGLKESLKKGANIFLGK